MTAADVHAAGESLAAVDDQKFAVVTKVDVGAVAEWQVAHDMHRRVYQQFEGRDTAVLFPKGIDDDPHLDTPLSGILQVPNKLRPNAVGIKDITAQVDAGLSLPNSLQHGWIG